MNFLLHLPFECDWKGFFEPVLSDPSKAIQLLMTKVPNPDNDENMYPVHMLILSLEALENPIVDVAIAEGNMSSACQAKTWLEMWKTA